MRLTVGQLAQAAGMTVRNVRNHHSRGLLPPPSLEARTGYYDERHLERLRLIREMQADGYNLEAIRRLLSDAEVGPVAPMPVDAPAVLTADDLATLLGGRDADVDRLLADIRASCETMARAFIDAFGAGDDPVAAVERLRPVAARTVATLFEAALAAEGARALDA